MSRVGTFVWRGLDSTRMEIAHAQWSSDGLVAQGTQIRVMSEPYELRYRLQPGRLAVEVVGYPGLAERVHPPLRETPR